MPPPAGILASLVVTAAPHARHPLYGTAGEPVAALARLAASAGPGGREPPVIFPAPPLRMPAALFYGNRPIEEASTLDEPAVPAGPGEVKRILLAEDALPLVSAPDGARVLARAGPLVHATIRRRGSADRAGRGTRCRSPW